MPPVRSVTIAPDSVTIVTNKGTRTFTRANIPAAVLLQPIATIEANVNAALAASPALQGMQVVVHIFQVNPTLRWTFACADAGRAVRPNWWARLA